MNNNDIYSRDNLPVDRASNLLNELFRQRKFDDLSKDEKKVIFDTAVSALINIDSVFRWFPDSEEAYTKWFSDYILSDLQKEKDSPNNIYKKPTWVRASPWGFDLSWLAIGLLNWGRNPAWEYHKFFEFVYHMLPEPQKGLYHRWLSAAFEKLPQQLREEVVPWNPALEVTARISRKVFDFLQTPKS